MIRIRITEELSSGSYMYDQEDNILWCAPDVWEHMKKEIPNMKNEQQAWETFAHAGKAVSASDRESFQEGFKAGYESWQFVVKATTPVAPEVTKDEQVELSGSFSGLVWAQAFVQRFPSVSLEDAHAWFANALMRGYDHAHQETQPVLTQEQHAGIGAGGGDDDYHHKVTHLPVTVIDGEWPVEEYAAVAAEEYAAVAAEEYAAVAAEETK